MFLLSLLSFLGFRSALAAFWSYFHALFILNSFCLICIPLLLYHSFPSTPRCLLHWQTSSFHPLSKWRADSGQSAVHCMEGGLDALCMLYNFKWYTDRRNCHCTLFLFYTHTHTHTHTQTDTHHHERIYAFSQTAIYQRPEAKVCAANGCSCPIATCNNNTEYAKGG